MYEVWIVIRNAFWILGLSVLLATWSYARWAAQQARVRTRDKLKEKQYALSLDIGLVLFVTGMAATEPRPWATALWIVIGAAVMAQAMARIIRGRRQPSALQE